MPPTLLQLQSVGLQDVYLTQDPQINVFKYTYYRYVNFAIEVQKLTLNEMARFNKKSSCNIEKRGHLLSKLYLHIKLPALQKTSGSYLCWSDTIGYAIFSDPIELEINGVVVDRLYPQFLEMWHELVHSHAEYGKQFMIGKSDIYSGTQQNATLPLDLVIPLDFWFTKAYNLALPILSMYNQDIKVNFRLRDFLQVINYDGAEPTPVPILDSNIYAEYVYLDDLIVNTFQKQKHMYIIDQVQYHGDETIPANTSNYNTSLKFNHPVKELVFALAQKQNVDNNNYFVYSNENNTNILSDASLLLDGQRRFEFLPEFYYRNAFTNNVHSSVPLKYIYTIPFCIKPEDNQPTGSLNMSRFNDVTLALHLEPNNMETYLYLYAINYNILTIHQGTFSLEFAT